jgi:hypothetical protein
MELGPSGIARGRRRGDQGERREGTGASAFAHLDAWSMPLALMVLMVLMV